MANDFKDYYQILGVAKDATQAEVKKAFRKLARVHHPDVAADKATAESKFKEINEAYEVLGDTEKRKKYDTLGANWDQPGGGYQGGPMPGGAEFEFDGTGFSDFFERYFSGGGARRAAGYGGGFTGRGGATNGQDIEGDLMVTLEEAFTGSMRTIALRLLARISLGGHQGGSNAAAVLQAVKDACALRERETGPLLLQYRNELGLRPKLRCIGMGSYAKRQVWL